MLHNWIRIFYSDNGVLTDYSIEAQSTGDTVPAGLVAAQDYIYIGQYFPFNNVYFEMDTTNDAVAMMSVEYWDGRSWKTGVDILDGTKQGGKTLKRNGVIQFSPDRQYSWVDVKDTSENGSPTELQTLEIYDLYWVRLKANASLDAGSLARKIGYAFASNDTLLAIDPEINEYLVPWGGSSKVNWDEQIQLASQHLVADMRAKGLIISPGNILRFDDVSLACAYRTLAVIYSRLGEAFAARKADALDQYSKLLDVKRFTIDADKNGRVDRSEIGSTSGGLLR